MAANKKIVIYRGWTLTIELPQVDRSGAPRNITGSTFEMVIAQSGVTIASVSLEIDDPMTGEISGVLDPAETAALPAVGTFGLRYAVTETLPSGAREIRAHGEVFMANPLT